MRRDRATLVYNPAILKYPARRAGLYPEEIDERYQADMQCSALRDFTLSNGMARYAPDPAEGLACR